MEQEFLLSLYREMLFYRRFEERVQNAYTQRKFSGFCHLHSGQEAVCVGVSRNLQEEDYVVSSYRSHTQAIAKGIPALAVFAELLGKKTGCCRGKGGSMHMFSQERRFLGGHGIVGGQAPIAVGAAFAERYRGSKAVVVCFLGDAALNQGQVFESLNMAQIWNLPVLFLVENNRYGMGTDIQRTTSIDHLYKRALGFDMAHGQVDGMNVLNVYEKVGEVLEFVRNEKAPFFLEALTYRYKGHSVSDPATYRTKEEVASFQEKDPLLQLKPDLLAAGIGEEQLESVSKEIKAELKEIEKEAEQADPVDIAELWQHVYAS